MGHHSAIKSCICDQRFQRSTETDSHSEHFRTEDIGSAFKCRISGVFLNISCDDLDDLAVLPLIELDQSMDYQCIR